MYEHSENVNKEIKNIIQTEVLAELKNTLEEFNNRLVEQKNESVSCKTKQWMKVKRHLQSKHEG